MGDKSKDEVRYDFTPWDGTPGPLYDTFDTALMNCASRSDDRGWSYADHFIVYGHRRGRTSWAGYRCRRWGSSTGKSDNGIQKATEGGLRHADAAYHDRAFPLLSRV